LRARGGHFKSQSGVCCTKSVVADARGVVDGASCSPWSLCNCCDVCVCCGPGKGAARPSCRPEKRAARRRPAAKCRASSSGGLGPAPPPHKIGSSLTTHCPLEALGGGLGRRPLRGHRGRQVRGAALGHPGQAASDSFLGGFCAQRRPGDVYTHTVHWPGTSAGLHAASAGHHLAWTLT